MSETSSKNSQKEEDILLTRSVRVDTNDLDLLALKKLALELTQPVSKLDEVPVENEPKKESSPTLPKHQSSTKSFIKEAETNDVSSSPPKLMKDNFSSNVYSSNQVRYSFTIQLTVPVSGSSETFTAYLVDITDNLTQTKRNILKRFRQFHMLHEQLKKDYGKKDTPKFTSKKLIGNLKPEFVEKRCQKLEAYLNQVARLPNVTDKVYFKKFLQEDPNSVSKFFRKSSFINKGKKLNSSESSNSLSKKPIDSPSSSPTSSKVSGSFNLFTSSPNPSPPSSFSLSSSAPSSNSFMNPAPKKEPIQDFLDLKNSGLSFIPPPMLKNESSLKVVTELDLSGNQFTMVPPLSAFVNLEKLNFCANQISNLEHLAACTKLTNLNLSKNKISQFNVVVNFTNLKILNVSHNPIALVPLELKACKTLEILDISYCDIVVFPEELLKMDQLKELYINDNSIFELPSEIYQLENLKSLNVSNNDLKDLPLSIGLCKSLETDRLLIDGNPLNEEILRKSKNPLTFMSYLKERVKDWKPNKQTPPKPVSSPQPSSSPQLSSSPSFLTATSFKDLSPEQAAKLANLRQNGLLLLARNVLPKLTEIKEAVLNASSFEEIKAWGKFVKALRSNRDRASEQDYWSSVEVASSLLAIAPPPEIQSNFENKMQFAQDLILYFLSHDLRRTLVALKHVLETSSNPSEIVNLVKFLKDMDILLLEY